MHELVRICQHPHSLTLISPDPSLHNQSQNANEGWGSADQSVIWLHNTHRLQRKQSTQGEKTPLQDMHSSRLLTLKSRVGRKEGGKKTRDCIPFEQIHLPIQGVKIKGRQCKTKRIKREGRVQNLVKPRPSTWMTIQV
jgi:hypothetical protein